MDPLTKPGDKDYKGETTGEIQYRYGLLQTEIAKPEYAGMSDTEICTALNTKTVPGRGPIAGDNVKSFFVRTGVIGAAKLYADDTGNDKALRSACQTVCDSFALNAFANFDLDDPAAKTDADQFTNSLVATQLMSADQRDELYAMADTATPWTDHILELPLLYPPDIEAARAFK